MSGQNRKQRILSDLAIVSSLRPGKTLSSSTMTIVGHEDWSTKIWRTYSRENRKDTINFIKNIFNEAIAILSISPSQDLFTSISNAAIGFGHLRETYKGDYYIIAEINRIIVDITQRSTASFSGNSQRKNTMESSERIPGEIMLEDFPEEDSINSSEPTLEECIQELVMSKLNETDQDENDRETVLEGMVFDQIIQKIPARENITKRAGRDGNSPHIKEMVSASDRESISETIEATISSNGGSNSSEDCSSVSNIAIIPTEKISSEDRSQARTETPQSSFNILSTEKFCMEAETSQSITKRNDLYIDFDYKYFNDEYSPEDESYQQHFSNQQFPSQNTEQEISNALEDSKFKSQEFKDPEINSPRMVRSQSVDILSQESPVASPEKNYVVPKDDETLFIKKNRKRENRDPIENTKCKTLNSRVSIPQLPGNVGVVTEAPQIRQQEELPNGGPVHAIDLSTWIHIQSIPRNTRVDTVLTSTPPIIRLAKSFKQWLDTVKESSAIMKDETTISDQQMLLLM